MILSMKLWRVWLLMVLSVLLPVRTGLAVTMALPATAMPSTAVTAQADTLHPPCAHHEDRSTAAPMTMGGHHVSQVTDESPSHHNTDTSSAQGHGSHLLCDVCNVPALQASVPLHLSPQVPPVGTPHRSERFDSVVLPIGHKPPIAP